MYIFFVIFLCNVAVLFVFKGQALNLSLPVTHHSVTVARYKRNFLSKAIINRYIYISSFSFKKHTVILRCFIPFRGHLLDKDVTSDGPGHSLQTGCAEQIFLQSYFKNLLPVLHASSAYWLCSALKIGRATAKKKGENGFGVFKKEDSVAQEEPWFKMLNRPETPVSSNKAARDCVITPLPYLKI